ncbi:uncharacterized protein LOC116187505 isoform X2 [Punica granatum]|uniref:Uncharacterized protein LOC116187505 isoform X2 n=1 Tax=Punica granatum TaxID=22663 RepID=A0A6P8BQ18_PUNGR|nr:uncharacterized protein LOC116187505 isoform X2 [Punica granatum]
MAEPVVMAGGFQEAGMRPWPAPLDHHLVLSDEACEANKEWISRGGQKQNHYDDHYRHNLHRHRPRFRAEPPSPPLKSSSSSRARQHQQRQKIQSNIDRAAYGGGQGMQAFFLNSCPRSSSGTGVFLPQRLDTDNNNSDSLNRKPACAPVLLPTRVVQALNLNVHALGLQISPRQDSKDYKGISGEKNSGKKKNNVIGKDTTQCCVVSENRSSPHIFLPKEWTY